MNSVENSYSITQKMHTNHAEGGNGLTSSAAAYYGDSIRAMIQKVLAEMGVENAVVKAVDHGALDCTIRARTTTAVRRAVKEEAVQ